MKFVTVDDHERYRLLAGRIIGRRGRALVWQWLNGFAAATALSPAVGARVWMAAVGVAISVSVLALMHITERRIRKRQAAEDKAAKAAETYLTFDIPGVRDPRASAPKPEFKN